MSRRLATIPAAFLAILLLTMPALAGGWAEIRPDAATEGAPPIEGEPVVFGFTVLQHGETPAGWVTPIVTLRELTSGATVDVTAAPSGPEGHFSVSFVPKQAGTWVWTVELEDLIADPLTVPIAVHHADGTAPMLDGAQVMHAIDGATRDLRLRLEHRISSEATMFDQRLNQQIGLTERLVAQVDAITEERDALAQRLADAEAAASRGTADEAESTLMVVLLAVLAGATAGFAMSWLAGRGGVREVAPLSPPAARLAADRAPRGSTPA